MKICILTPNYLPHMGGVEMVTFHMAKELSHLGHEVHVVTIQEVDINKKNLGDSTKDTFSNGNIYITRINLPLWFLAERSSAIKNILFIISAFIEVGKIRPEIVHAQNFIPSISAYLSKIFFNIPYTICVHTEKFSSTGWGIVLPLLLKKYWPNLPHIKHSDVIFALTDITRLEIQKYLNKNSITIPNGVDLDLFKPDQIKLESHPHMPKIVCISRLEANKGIECALHAMKLIVKRYPDSKLVVIGGGSIRKELEELMRDLAIEKNVEFIGEVQNVDVPNYLSSANIYLLTSFNEGFSISLLEAMASGLPVISTPVGIAPNVHHKWNNGYLVPIKNPHAIYEAVINMTENPDIRSMFSRNSIEKSKEYAWDRIVKQYEKEYYNILDLNLKNDP